MLRKWNSFSKVTQASKDQSSLLPEAELFSADCRDFARAYGLLHVWHSSCFLGKRVGPVRISHPRRSA